MNKPSKNRLEWSVFGVSAVLVIATLGFLIRESLVSRDGPPDVIATVGSPRSAHDGFQVPVEIRNVGQTTAEDIVIPVVLDLGDGAQEEGQINVAFLPRNSKVEGWVKFRSDPRRGRVTLGAIAFEAP